VELGVPSLPTPPNVTWPSPFQSRRLRLSACSLFYFFTLPLPPFGQFFSTFLSGERLPFWLSPFISRHSHSRSLRARSSSISEYPWFHTAIHLGFFSPAVLLPRTWGPSYTFSLPVCAPMSLVAPVALSKTPSRRRNLSSPDLRSPFCPTFQRASPNSFPRFPVEQAFQPFPVYKSIPYALC